MGDGEPVPDAAHEKDDSTGRDGCAAVLDDLLIGPSTAMQALRAEIRSLAASTPRSVLVVGETGVGKDLVAHGLRACTPSTLAAVEVFNCPAIPSDHLESELFGTTRGAYPGAVDRPGAVERAAGGILVLDEVGAMAPAHQGKLLRLLENGEGRRLGGRGPYAVDLCVVAATNEDLHAAIDAGRFRRDLYYRLVQDAVLRIPPLRARHDDVEPLAMRFLGEIAPGARLRGAALERLRGHTWPGNVRELRAVVRSAARLAAPAEITSGHVGEALARIGAVGAANPPEGAQTAQERFRAESRTVRRRMLEEALVASGGNRTRAGILLGLHRSSGDAGAGIGEGDPGLAARKRAHRKFDYWWQRLVETGR